MSDSNFPNRPDHPDFWLLSRLVCQLDERSDRGGPDEFARILAEYIDPASLTYMAEQRALRARLVGAPDMALYFDAFVLGVAAERARARGEK
jgi:hypothetical protein